MNDIFKSNLLKLDLLQYLKKRRSMVSSYISYEKYYVSEYQKSKIHEYKLELSLLNHFIRELEGA